MIKLVDVIRILVKPKVWVNQNLVGAPLGDDVEIDCFIEAYPRSITYWQKTNEGKEIILMNGYGLNIHQTSYQIS